MLLFGYKYKWEDYDDDSVDTFYTITDLETQWRIPSSLARLGGFFLLNTDYLQTTNMSDAYYTIQYTL